ncbi:MAG: LiaF-related protein [Clostridium sp.]
MNSKLQNGLWGSGLIVLGLLFAGNAFNIWDFNLFFDGWWTLFIIVPCTIGLFEKGFRASSFLGVVVGVLLFLSAQNILSFVLVGKLIIPVILVFIGMRMIYRNFFDSDRIRMKKVCKNGMPDYISIFSSNEVNFPYEVFKGANLISIFGGIDLDLRNAIINDDTVINSVTIFGGTEIIVPPNVKVKVISTPIFGGVSDDRKYIQTESVHTVYVKAVCIFGGIDIK